MAGSSRAAAGVMDINRDDSDVTLGKHFQTLENLQLETCYNIPLTSL